MTKDVMFFFQAHMLSPLRFYDDMLQDHLARYYPDKATIRLKEIVRTRA
jgi:hypothetical protein